MKATTARVARWAARRGRDVRTWCGERLNDLRERFDRHRREIRLRLLYGAVSALGSWGAGIIIAWLMARY